MLNWSKPNSSGEVVAEKGVTMFQQSFELLLC